MPSRYAETSRGNLCRGFALISLLLLAAACARSAPPIPPPVPAPAQPEIETTVFFIGDVGHTRDTGEPSLLGLADELKNHPDTTLVVFLGDNIYPRGLPDSSDGKRSEYERYLDDQIEVVLAAVQRAAG